VQWLILGLLWIAGCAAPSERLPLPVSPAPKESPKPKPTSASAPSPVFVLPTSFSPSGNSVVYWDEHQVATVVSLADCHVIAKVAERPEHVVPSGSGYDVAASLPSDGELVFIYPNPDTEGFAERRALPSGAVLGGGPAYERFSTPLGTAYFDVRRGEESLLPARAELVLPESGATPRRINLLPKFGGLEWLRLSVLGTVGNTLVVHLEGAIGAMSVQRVGTIDLKSGAVQVAPTLVATTGAVAFAKNRVALVQEDDSPVFVYELPSLRRLSVTREAGFTEQRYEDFTLGQPYSCVALSPDAHVVAAYRDDDAGLRWFDAASGRRLGKLEVPRLDSPEFCRLSFTADGRKLALATDKSSVLVASVENAKVLFSFAWGGCAYDSHEAHCDGRSVLSADARFFAAIEPGKQEDRAHFVDIESGEAHDLGPVPSPELEFDPTSRYLVLAGRVWSTSPLRSLCTLP